MDEKNNVTTFPVKNGPYAEKSLRSKDIHELYKERVATILKSNHGFTVFAPTFKWIEAKEYRKEFHTTTQNWLSHFRIERLQGSSSFKIWAGDNARQEIKHLIMLHFYQNKVTRKQRLINSLPCSERHANRIIKAAVESGQIITEQDAGLANMVIYKPSTSMVHEYEESLAAYYRITYADSKESSFRDRWKYVVDEFDKFIDLRDQVFPETILEAVTSKKYVENRKKK